MQTPTIISNKTVQDYLKNNGMFDYEDVPSWLDDLLEGAIQHYSTGNRPLNKGKVLLMLSCFKLISIESVASYLNVKHNLRYERDMSERMVKYWFAVLRCASGSISLYLHNNPELKGSTMSGEPIPPSYTGSNEGIQPLSIDEAIRLATS